MRVYIVFLNDHIKGVFKERSTAERHEAKWHCPVEGCYARIETHTVTIG